MADVTQTRYALYHPKYHMALYDQPYWSRYDINAQYRDGNIHIEDHHFRKKAWYPNYKWVEADEFVAMELDDNTLKKGFKAYKSKNLANNIRKKFIRYAQLLIDHPTPPKKDSSYYTRKGTNMDKAKSDLKFAEGIEVIEVKYTTDPEDVVQFVEGKVKCIKQKAKCIGSNVCSGCGMKLKKLPAIYIEKPTSYQGIYLCPICAYNLHKIAEPLYNGMDPKWLEKAQKQVFVKTLTDL